MNWFSWFWTLIIVVMGCAFCLGVWWEMKARDNDPARIRRRNIKAQSRAYWKHIAEIEREHKRHLATWKANAIKPGVSDSRRTDP